MIADIVVGAVVLVSALISFMRGFIREVLTIVGVVGGLLAALFAGPVFVPIVNGWFGVKEGEEPEKIFDLIPEDMVATATAYGLIFLVVVIALSLASHFLAAGAKAIGLGPVDRTLGLIFGIARAVLLLGLLYLPFHLLVEQENKEKFFEGSRTHFVIEKTSEVIAGFLPESGEGSVSKTVEDSFKKSLMEQELLKKEGSAAQDDSAPDEASSETGYKDQQRGAMEKLFEQPKATPSQHNDKDRPRYNE